MSDRKFTPVCWSEVTYGARFLHSPSPQRYQIWRMECHSCDFYIEPLHFRSRDDLRKDHPQAYGNLASISHARKLMREHVEAKHKAALAKAEAPNE